MASWVVIHGRELFSGSLGIEKKDMYELIADPDVVWWPRQSRTNFHIILGDNVLFTHTWDSVNHRLLRITIPPNLVETYRLIIQQQAVGDAVMQLLNEGRGPLLGSSLLFIIHGSFEFTQSPYLSFLTDKSFDRRYPFTALDLDNR